MKSWVRSDLKWRAKEAFRKNYWSAVLVSVILVILMAAGGGSAAKEAAKTATSNFSYESGILMDNEGLTEHVQNFTSHDGGLWNMALAVFGAGLLMACAVIGIVFRFFVGNVLEVGARRFYIENLYSSPGVGRILSGFQSGYYWNVVKTMFLRNVFVALWTLLLVIPGIVKSYEYRMVPYLLAEYPDMSGREAFARSREMMYGQKMDAFVLDLSFIPWNILSYVTFGLGGIFYANPYIDATGAELYDVLASDTAGSSGSDGGYTGCGGRDGGSDRNM